MEEHVDERSILDRTRKSVVRCILFPRGTGLRNLYEVREDIKTRARPGSPSEKVFGGHIKPLFFWLTQMYIYIAVADEDAYTTWVRWPMIACFPFNVC